MAQKREDPMTERRSTRWWFGLFILLLVWGCASTGARTDRSAELLAKSYATMSDAELQTYYFQLNDQIARVERSATGTRVGAGVGSYPVRAGVSGEVPRQTVADELRDRRNLVRTEMSRRGLRP
jgi:hypothetical protein